MFCHVLSFCSCFPLKELMKSRENNDKQCTFFPLHVCQQYIDHPIPQPFASSRKQEMWQTSCRSAWSETPRSWLRCLPRTGGMFGSRFLPDPSRSTALEPPKEQHWSDRSKFQETITDDIGKTLTDYAFLRSQDWLIFPLLGIWGYSWLLGRRVLSEHLG